VEVVGTTDDPADDLTFHEAIARAPFGVRVVPTFRPDAAFRVHDPARLHPWVRRLSETSGTAADTFPGLLAALERRHADFAAAGCRASDHGLLRLPDDDCTEAEAAAIWTRAMAGTAATTEEAEKFTLFLLLHVARLNHDKGWALQLHLGPVRDPNPLLARALGADAGCDTIGDARQGPGLVRFLGRLSAEAALPRTILYNINPADNALFAAMPGSFQDGTIPGKIQWGSAWWFMDQERGMRDQMNMLSDLGLLSRFVGMVTDSRSFLSYPRGGGNGSCRWWRASAPPTPATTSASEEDGAAEPERPRPDRPAARGLEHVHDACLRRSVDSGAWTVHRDTSPSRGSWSGRSWGSCWRRCSPTSASRRG
jgi:glucuronate isomerase